PIRFAELLMTGTAEALTGRCTDRGIYAQKNDYRRRTRSGCLLGGGESSVALHRSSFIKPLSGGIGRESLHVVVGWSGPRSGTIGGELLTHTCVQPRFGNHKEHGRAERWESSANQNSCETVGWRFASAHRRGEARGIEYRCRVKFGWNGSHCPYRAQSHWA